MVLILSGIPAIMLFLHAFGFWPLHLSLIRWTVTGCAALLFVAGKRESLPVSALLIALLFLFNPLFPIHLPHVTFTNLEIIAGVCFAAAGLLLF